MNKEWVLTQEAFDELLFWLDPNREQAGKKYEEIRRRLIKLFTCRGCREADDLADETINRVTNKAQEMANTYSGDPALYFYGVAHNVHLEYLRRSKKSPPPPPATVWQPDETEREYNCLERCIEHLTSGNRELVLEYYRDEKKAKIDHRKLLAQRLGIAVNALRIRAHRIRATLQECMHNCMAQEAAR